MAAYARSAPAPLQDRLLARTSLARVYDVDCPGHDSRGEELSASPVLILVRRGGFTWRDRAGSAVADAGCAILAPAGTPHRIAHTAPGGDRCTVVAFHGALAPAEALDAEAARPVRVLAPVAHLLHRQLVYASTDALALDELVTALLAQALAPWPSARPARARTRRATRDAHRDLAARARRALADSPERAWSIAALAAHVATSPFHLCRVFRAEVGVPIHRYQRRLRLLSALERRLEHGADFTTAALDAGFSSHSHFTAAFTAEFGVPPSRASSARPRKRARS